MAFEPSYNLLDKDTHNTLVEALKSGGIGYTEADGTVHKISGDYVEGGGGGSSLPEVTSDDNGDVLTVVSGEWAKAAPSGGSGGFDAAIRLTSGGEGVILAEVLSGTFADCYAKLYTNKAPINIGVVSAIDEGLIYSERILGISAGEDEGTGKQTIYITACGLLSPVDSKGELAATDGSHYIEWTADGITAEDIGA